jgi:hypothetical protein
MNVQRSTQRSKRPVNLLMPYVNRLRGLIKSCRYENFADEFFRDRIVLSICYRNLQKRFYENRNLTLVDVINQLKASKVAQL